MANVKKNLGFQTAYQILNTCLPLITAPYLSRVLGAEKLGIYSYTSSIVAYFTLIAMLGTVNYGSRSVAAAKKNKSELANTFWSIFFLQAIITVIAFVAYIVYWTFICKDNRTISLIQAIAIIDCFFNINWLFFGLEKFQLTVTRSFFVRIITVLAIILLIKKPSDLWLYTLIMLCGGFLSNIVLWVYVPREVSFSKVTVERILRHLKPNLLLFIPLLAMSVYHIMDKTMLGYLSNYTQSGYYYNADKIVNITVGIISGISTVMLPRMTTLISEGKSAESDNLFRTSLEGTVFVGTAMAFGIASIANEFEPLFFGPGYEQCIILTIVLAPVLLIKSFAFTARYQYLIPHKQEKAYITSVLIGAGINLIFNLLLIPQFGAMGAVIGTLLAELAACIWQFITIQRLTNISVSLLKCMVYFLIGIAMFFLVRFVSHINADVVLKIVAEVFVGIVSYISLSVFYWKISKNNIHKMIFGDILMKIINK